MQYNQKNQSGHTPLLALLGIVVLAGIVAIGLRVHQQMDSKTVNLGKGPTVTASSNQAATTSTSSSTPSSTIPAGSSNADLNSDLTSINSSIAQDNGNVTAANSAVNDQQNEITVPTN